MDRELAIRRLEQARQEVLAARQEVVGDQMVGEPPPITEVLDPVDVAAVQTERIMDQSIVDMVAERLAELDDALARVDDGTYGRCEVCGDEIPDERLAAVPWARRCTEHQQVLEQTRTGLEERP